MFHIATNQQFRKDVYNIIIQQSFLDGNVVFEADIDLVKIFLKTVRIMEIDHRIPAVHDCFKIAAGIGTVKMQPFCIPSSGGIVAVRFIAVQQDNLVRPGMTDPPSSLDFTASLLHVHNQKAVIGRPPETVSGEIAEITCADGIQEHGRGLRAWSMDIKIRAGNHTLFGR